MSHYCCKTCGLRYDDCRCGELVIKLPLQRVPYAKPCELLVDEIRTWGPIGPVTGTIMLAPGVHLGVRAPKGSKHLHLTHLWTSPTFRGRGHAAVVLRRLLEAATRLGVSVKLRPYAFDRDLGGPTTRQLTTWYLRHGFARAKGTPTSLVWYPPVK
jgi:GNAT superfamily N-acetyltransferase